MDIKLPNLLIPKKKEQEPSPLYIELVPPNEHPLKERLQEKEDRGIIIIEII